MLLNRNDTNKEILLNQLTISPVNVMAGVILFQRLKCCWHKMVIEIIYSLDLFKNNNKKRNSKRDLVFNTWNKNPQLVRMHPIHDPAAVTYNITVYEFIDQQH